MTKFIAFLSGLLFSAGLIIGGMSDPQKILAFLDITGNWDPSLFILMLSALCISVVGYLFARQHQHTLLGCAFSIPTNRKIDKPLVIGSILFGIGWGLAGICPGPSLILVGAGFYQGAIFVTAMIVGSLLIGQMRKSR